MRFGSHRDLSFFLALLLCFSVGRLEAKSMITESGQAVAIEFEGGLSTLPEPAQKLISEEVHKRGGNNGLFVLRAYIGSLGGFSKNMKLLQSRTREIRHFLIELGVLPSHIRAAPPMLTDDFKPETDSDTDDVDSELLLLSRVELRFTDLVEFYLLTGGKDYFPETKAVISAESRRLKLSESTITYAPGSIPLFPAGKSELSSLFSQANPSDVYVQIQPSLKTRANFSRKSLTGRRVAELEAYLLSQGVLQNHFLPIEGNHSQDYSNKIKVSVFENRQNRVLASINDPSVPLPTISAVRTEMARLEEFEKGPPVFLISAGSLFSSKYSYPLIGLERALWSHLAVGATATYLTADGSALGDKFQGPVASAHVSLYSAKHFRGLWMKFAAIAAPISLSGAGTEKHLVTGATVLAGISLRTDLPFTFRGGVGFQYFGEKFLSQTSPFSGTSSLLLAEFCYLW